jgi:Zn-dependent peptidase ImmA (M78 family)
LEKVEQNIDRLKFLLKLFRISAEDLLNMVSVGLKKPILVEEIFSKNIKLSYLKKIDRVFNKGLHYYLDPKSPEEFKEESIFFRKTNFNTELNFGAKKVVTQFEEFKISLTAISKLAEINFSRVLPIFSVSDNPKETAIKIRNSLYPNFNKDQKEFLKSLIGKLAQNNILVFEFVETWNKIDKANIDGFFLDPFVIVLKRQQFSYRREIFTLAHELGHFLINEEEIEKLDYDYISRINLSKIERWCNDFAYYFLIGEFDNYIREIDKATAQNDYYHELISDISSKTHLSEIALYTRLLYENKILQSDYEIINEQYIRKFKEGQEEKKLLKELAKEQGIKQKGSAPQPIKSPLLISTIQAAFYEGVISEYEVCKHLNIKPEKFEDFIHENYN